MQGDLVPVGVAEVARRLNVDVRQIYQNANKEARVLAERWRQHMRRRGEQSVERARDAIDAACQDILSERKAINRREIRKRVPQEVLGSVKALSPCCRRRGIVSRRTEGHRRVRVQDKSRQLAGFFARRFCDRLRTCSSRCAVPIKHNVADQVNNHNLSRWPLYA